MKASKFLLAVAAGAAAGAILGILFAPDKGSETRRKISSKSNDLANAVKDNCRKILDTVSDSLASASAEVKGKVEKEISKFN